jgi:hypothetical protein
MIDRIGRPAKSRFTILRPKPNGISLEVLWAVMNSPFANAFAYAHSVGWNILTGTLRKLPVPEFGSERVLRIEEAVKRYFEAVTRYEAPFPLRSDDARAGERNVLRELYWRIDAEVLRLYGLPVELERELLDYFSGWQRVGMPFEQDRYLPEHFDEAISLADFLGITADWDTVNKRRLRLVDKKATGTLEADERDDLAKLQGLAGLKRELLSSPSLKELADMEADLRRRGLWRGV